MMFIYLSRRNRESETGTLQFCNEPKKNCMHVNGQLLIVNGKDIRGSGQNSLFLQN